MSEIFSLFATPVYISKDESNNSFKEELDFLETIEYKFNSPSNWLSCNTKILQESEMARCKQILNYHLNFYVRECFSCEQDFYMTNSWIAKTNKNESHHIHSHPNSIISGIIYLQAEDASEITFTHNSALKESFGFSYHVKKFNIFNSESWSFKVNTGDIMIFPSSLLHSVSSHNSEKPRIVLGFNTFVKGCFGNETYSSDLTL